MSSLNFKTAFAVLTSSLLVSMAKAGSSSQSGQTTTAMPGTGYPCPGAYMPGNPNVMLEGTSLNDARLCDQMIQPSFYPSDEYPRLFTASLVYNIKKARYNCYVSDTDALSYEAYYNSLGSNWNNYWDLAKKFSHMSAVLNVFLTLYIKRADGSDGKIGRFGPIFMRTFDPWDEDDFMKSEKVAGFLRKGDSFGYTSRYFVPDPLRNDPIISGWGPGKLDFEAGISTAATCLYRWADNRIWEAEASVTSYGWFINYLPKETKTVDGTVNGVFLKQTVEKKYQYLQFRYKWSDNDQSSFTKAVLDSRDCYRPWIYIVVYDSNPAPHGNWDNDVHEQYNSHVRAVLGMYKSPVYYELEGGLVVLHEVYDMIDPDWKEAQLTEFLYGWRGYQPKLDGKSKDKVFFQDWDSKTGLSAAITICQCNQNLGIFELRRGCREYIHFPVTIEDRDPQPPLTPPVQPIG